MVKSEGTDLTGLTDIHLHIVYRVGLKKKKEIYTKNVYL